MHRSDIPMNNAKLPELVEPRECMLYLSGSSQKVGKGICYPNLSAMLHNRPLPLNHMKVRVDFAYDVNAPLPIPLEDAEIRTVGEAIGTFVAWPEKLIDVSDLCF